MANTIKLKRASGSDPGNSDLAVGELAIRTSNCKLFSKNDGGSAVGVVAGSADTLTTARNIAGVSFDGSANISLNNNAITNGAGYITDLVSDTSPQLGGDLDMNSQSISSGILNIKNTGSQSEVRLYCEVSNAHYVSIKAPAHSTYSGNLTYTLPPTVTNGYFLQTNSSGVLSWAAVDLTALSATNLTSGTIPDARFPSTLPALNGSALTNLNGSNIASGTIAAARVATLNQDTTGTAAIATTVTVADESSDTSCNVLFATAATGNLAPKSGTNLTFNSSSGILTATGFAGALTGNVTGNASGSSGSCTGNAATATALATARNIAGVSFDGTSNISLNNNAITNGAGYITDVVNDTSPQLGGDLQSNGNNIDFADNDKAFFGSGNDMLIEHDGSHSYIDNNTGDLIIRCDGDDVKILSEDDVVIRDNDDSTNMLRCVNGGAVELYHNGSLMAQTAADGLEVTGSLTTQNIDCTHATLNIQNGGGSKTAAAFNPAAGQFFYHNHTLKLNTSSSGITVSGTCTATAFSGDGSALTNLPSSGLPLSGGELTGDLITHVVKPDGNGTRSLGTSSLRWSDVFTSDLHLSNKGSSNKVDNSWGDFTIQEGMEDLFLINNRNGKMYKFVLKEVG